MILPRLYPILDTESLARRGCAVEAAAHAMLEGGTRILQFRHKGFFSRAVVEQAERVALLCRDAGARFVVDDRADIALLLGAGVHVGQEDLTPADARQILGDRHVVGFSTHNEAQLQAAAAEPIDYVALGPIFGTQSKERPDPVLGVAELARLRPLARHPLVAIGGITRESARQLIDAGADAVAVIADLLPEPCTEQAILKRMEEWQRLLK